MAKPFGSRGANLSLLLVEDLIPSLDSNLEAFLKNFFLGANMVKLIVGLQSDMGVDDKGK